MNQETHEQKVATASQELDNPALGVILSMAAGAVLMGLWEFGVKVALHYVLVACMPVVRVVAAVVSAVWNAMVPLLIWIYTVAGGGTKGWVTLAVLGSVVLVAGCYLATHYMLKWETREPSFAGKRN